MRTVKSSKKTVRKMKLLLSDEMMSKFQKEYDAKQQAAEDLLLELGNLKAEVALKES